MGNDDFVGFGLSGYRSFGDGSFARVGPMSKIHLIVGQNNVGKSNVLHFAHDVLQQVKASPTGSFNLLFPEQLDSPDGWTNERVRSFSLALRLTAAVREKFGLATSGRWTQTSGETMLRLLDTTAFSPTLDDEVVWFDFDLTQPQMPGQPMQVQPNADQFRQALQQVSDPSYASVLSNYSGALTQTASGDQLENFTNIVRAWAPWQFIPPLSWVDAIREVTGSEGVRVGQAANGLRDGRGLREELARLQAPEHTNYDADKAKFDALQEFTRTVLSDDVAEILIPNRGTDILVMTKNGRKPISRLGTGISELIMLAAASTVTSGALVCIEEPELHLHPTLQRRFLQYIYDHTDNRYLISTHSAAMLNAELASISHVTMGEKWSRVDPVSAPRALANAVGDLGNRASDLVQSNYVVWVEGPSDRIYICSWLKEFAPELIEGSHYSVMFYGGALLNHLAVEDPEVDEFIDLSRINRHMAIVIDSDKSGEDDVLNATKLRVIQELKDAGAFGWVTDGYTIENYVPRQTLEETLALCYPGKTYVVPTGRWKSPLAKSFKDMVVKPSKTTVGRAVAALDPRPSWALSLPDRVHLLADHIRRANDLPRPGQQQPIGASDPQLQSS